MTHRALKRIRIAFDASKLEKETARILNRHAADYENGAAGVMADLAEGGCISGLIPELINYSDTERFYLRHAKEINEMLLGEWPKTFLRPTFARRFGTVDGADPLVLDTYNRNILAWWAFETTAFSLWGDA